MSRRLALTRSDFPTLTNLLRWRAAERPDDRALSFEGDDGGDGRAYTFGELDEQARAIAAHLQALGLGVGERVFLFYPPGLEYVVALLGCLYAGLVPVPAYPANPARLTPASSRLLAIIRDAQPAAVLSTTSDFPAFQALRDHTKDLTGLCWVTSGDMDTALADHWRCPALQADALALLQYTSGSTTSPRGVMVSHRNLMHNLERIRRSFDISPDDTGVIWLPPYHDMGLIGGILGSFYSGNVLILMSPLTFLKRPFRWLETISRTRAAISGGPNFAYDLCVRRIKAEDCARLDLRSWAVAFTGAEPVRVDTLDRFAEHFRPCGFRREAFLPCYGLAETTLMATRGSRNSGPSVCRARRQALGEKRVVVAEDGEETDLRLVGCGESPKDQELLIVDPDTARPCPSDSVGEIWLAGPSVARGYWNRPEESQRMFQAFLADTRRGPYLRTGDLGFVKDGELFVVGRLKDLVICDGRNHYPEDIELTVAHSHPLLRLGDCTAFSVDTENEETLVILAELPAVQKSVVSGQQGPVASSSRSPRSLSTEVTRAIRRSLAENHGLRAHTVLLLKPGELLRTSSGKIQRQACRAAFLNGAFHVIGESQGEGLP